MATRQWEIKALGWELQVNTWEGGGAEGGGLLTSLPSDPKDGVKAST